MSTTEFATADGIATLRMTRPEKKNALTVAMYEVMANHLEGANDNSDIRCIIIAGAPGIFCAGNDIEDFLQFAGKGALGEPVLRFIRALVTSQKPLLAAVDGAAIGIGTTMLLHCDHVIASDRSVFATPFVDLGLLPEAGSSLIAPRLLGHQRAFELLAMGRRWDAARAEANGIVNEVVPHDALEARAHAVAQEIAGKAPEALALTRRFLRGDPADILVRVEAESKAFRERLTSPEARQAFMGFLARKKAG